MQVVSKLEFDHVGFCGIADAFIHLDHVELELWDVSSVNVTDKSLKIIAEATHLIWLYLISDLGLDYFGVFGEWEFEGFFGGT
ncbi:hypothetical protein Tco_1058204 [Tanacetum coccineum]|uniref:Uncharacterized protein n=1 Tax=Tanacetum coccineum TaxID=301880 RepID=A0ABQ5H9D4_9ASTR